MAMPHSAGTRVAAMLSRRYLTRERTRDVLWHKRMQGEWVGNVAYGLRLADDGRPLEGKKEGAWSAERYSYYCLQH